MKPKTSIGNSGRISRNCRIDRRRVVRTYQSLVEKKAQLTGGRYGMQHMRDPGSSLNSTLTSHAFTSAIFLVRGSSVPSFFTVHITPHR